MKPVKLHGLGLFFFLAVTLPASATLWESNAPSAEWFGIASSADGSKLVASGYFNGVFTSTNYGNTWIEQTNLAFLTVASSADGTKLIADSFLGPIYISTNSGVSWLPSLYSGLSWSAVASSADGTKLAVAKGYPNTGPIYTTTNSGAIWFTNSAPLLSWNGLVSSADGTKLLAVATTGQIYSTTNAGADWQPRLLISNNYWSGVASSADGSHLIASVNGGYIYTSTNFGISWNPTASSNNWLAVASSADGSKLVAVGTGTVTNPCPTITSTNFGNTWITNNAPSSNYWSSVTSSADGNHLAATLDFLAIYVSQTVPTPQLNPQLSGTNLLLDWVVPSTNFLIQQSSDLMAWTTLTNSPTLNLTNLQYQLYLSASNAQSFYRLSTQ